VNSIFQAREIWKIIEKTSPPLAAGANTGDNSAISTPGFIAMAMAAAHELLK
jgi:hypothetical protein